MYPQILTAGSLKDKNLTLVIYLPCKQDGPHATVLGWDSLVWNLFSYALAYYKCKFSDPLRWCAAECSSEIALELSTTHPASPC